MAVFYSPPFLWIIILLNLWPNLAAVIVGRYPVYPAIVSAAAVFGWMVWMFFTDMRRHAVVRLVRHSERMSFFQRKKDDLALAVISLVLGTVIGIIGTKLADKILKADVDTAHVEAPAQK